MDNKNRSAQLLFLIPLTVFAVEFYFLEHYYDIMYVSQVFYYVFVSGLFIWFINKGKIEPAFISFINMNLVFHVTVFVVMLNLPFLSYSLELASYIYPLFWLVYVVFDIFCILFFLKNKVLNHLPDAA